MASLIEAEEIDCERTTRPPAVGGTSPASTMYQTYAINACADLAERMGARYYGLYDLSRDEIASAVKRAALRRPVTFASPMAIDRYSYPFTAIVGQEKMKLALVLNAVNPSIGGVLIRGEKGTGKSTAVRALARLLPTRSSSKAAASAPSRRPRGLVLGLPPERAQAGPLPTATRRMRCRRAAHQRLRGSRRRHHRPRGRAEGLAPVRAGRARRRTATSSTSTR